MSSFNFTNVEINSGRKQIIDIEDDKKVIDDRGALKNVLLLSAGLDARVLTKSVLHQSGMVLLAHNGVRRNRRVNLPSWNTAISQLLNEANLVGPDH